MPNWCWNYLTISKRDADKYVFNNKQEVDFNILIPEPETKEQCEEKYIVKDPIASAIEIKDEKPWFNWYDWRCDKWGVKWNARRTEIHDYIEETGIYIIHFETPWGPPDEWLKALVNKGVGFYLDWEEEGGEHGIISHDSTQHIDIVNVNHETYNELKNGIINSTRTVLSHYLDGIPFYIYGPFPIPEDNKIILGPDELLIPRLSKEDLEKTIHILILKHVKNR